MAYTNGARYPMKARESRRPVQFHTEPPVFVHLTDGRILNDYVADPTGAEIPYFLLKDYITGRARAPFTAIRIGAEEVALANIQAVK